MSLESVAAQGDRRETLVALRDELAARIPDASDKDAAALAARLALILDQIEAVPDRKDVSAADEIAQRRAARRTKPASPARAKRPS